MPKYKLIEKAKKIRDQAYAPYSNFYVGAALLANSGKIYTGCNIENAAFSNTCCAERVAIFKAISSGERNFTAIAVVADSPRPVPPCGSCRQVMSEFFSEDTHILLANLKGESITFTMKDLLPFSFQDNDIQ